MPIHSDVQTSKISDAKNGESPLDLEAGRRAFIRTLGLGAASAALFGAAPGLSTDAQAQSAPLQDQDIFNFALNLEYLEAEFYLRSVTGQGLSDADVTGSGTPGTVSGGRQVNFRDRVVANLAREIAMDEQNHVRFFRSALGPNVIARPAIDLNQSFTTAARAAGLVGPNDTFDPYVDTPSFLFAAFIFEDVGVTAFKGAAPLLQNKAALEAAAGVLAVEAYHAGAIRTILYERGYYGQTARIADLRNNLDGPPNDDQGIGGDADSNIVPTDNFGLAFSRTPAQVLNIVYGNPNKTPGLFFPNGVNGVIR